ncbi:MAG: sigma-54 dependent transcriptional regulator [Acidobacteriota bacterium]|nr:sigma-54 dependent transcriptional regulator [Acidobacteriota bacterium]
MARTSKDPAGATVLVVDDEATNRQALRLVLEDEGYRIVEAGDGDEGLDKVRREEPDLVLLDIRMPKVDGMTALQQIRKLRIDLPVVMISGHGTIATAVEALRLGADDFLEKPLERDIVVKRIAALVERRKLQEKVAALEADEAARHTLVGESEPMRRVRELIRKAGPTQATVLITGESGTGKELVAREIHRASLRCAEAFIKVNCAAIPDELIESELFGHEKGAFTGAARKQVGRFARAHGGTLFLDEIGDMSVKTQAKVLRALQDGEIEPLGAGRHLQVDVRVLAATNKDLRDEIGDGRFREDLFYRLNVLPVPLPPLRERLDDLPALIEHFAARICEENNFRLRHFADGAIAKLRERTWPGNIRELRNYMERAIILTQNEEIEASDLPEVDQDRAPEVVSLMQAPTLKEFKERAEREFLRRKLVENEWNITRTAQTIGTPRSNLYKKLEAYDLERTADA